MNETITAIEKRATDAHAEAAAIIIRDQDTLTLANTKTLMLKALIKEIDDTFKPIYDAQKTTAKLTKDTWDSFRVPLDMDYCRIKTSIGAFLTEQDRLKKEAEHRAWQAEQEKVRAEAEARRVAEEALKKAAALEAKGQNEKAEQVLNKAAAQETKIAEKIEAATVAAAAPIPLRVQTSGISTRPDWDVKLRDINLVPREYMMWDEVKSRKAMRDSKGTIEIPGVDKIEKTIVSQRAV
jgi:hypothetical protein